jgi:hypothetical protein
MCVLNTVVVWLRMLGPYLCLYVALFDSGLIKVIVVTFEITIWELCEMLFWFFSSFCGAWGGAQRSLELQKSQI